MEEQRKMCDLFMRTEQIGILVREKQTETAARPNHTMPVACDDNV
jgi:hypothetical protein